MAATKRQTAKAITHNKLVEHARALFKAQGYEAVSMREVAKGVGMSTGAIFANFSGKEALWETCMGVPAPNVRQLLENLAGGGLGVSEIVQTQARRMLAALYGEGAA